MISLSALTQDGFIVRAAILWNKGCDTKSIAIDLSVTEAEVYNRLEQIKARAKAMAR